MTDDDLDDVLRKVAYAPARAPDARHVDARYELGRRLGEGGFGTVYEAFDRVRRERVALKLLRSATSEALLRFKREFRQLASVSDPGIVRLHELHGDGERWYFTMERIEGVPFDRAARDPERLAAVLDGLVGALSRLHARGWIHRDVKPENVLVEASGRVVLLDFGLLRIDADRASTAIVGTPLYVAPEVLAGDPPTAAADWYAVGVMLYEALTGESPFEGTALEVVRSKQLARPTPVLARAPGAPADLAALCDALLDPRPEVRPRPAPRAPVPAALAAAPYVGRTSELAALARATESAPCVVRVAGDSGVGKSTLVDRFADAARAAGTRVLRSRCDPRDHVPFGAIDGAVDELARILARLPLARARAVAPRNAATLAVAFPVLRAIPGFEPGPDRAGPRSRIGPALAELLARAGEGARWLLVVDDAQWGDPDSAAVLSEILREACVPLAVVAVHRTAAGGPFLEALAPGAEIRVGALPDDDARALAALAAEGHDVDAIVREAAGHPLLVVELARDRCAGGAARTLAEVVAARMEAQREPARRCARLVAVAGSALSRAALAELAIPASAIDELERARSLAREGGGGVRLIHDRVRELIVGSIGDDDARELHRALAGALRAVSPERAEAIAFHLAAAGVLGEAAAELHRAARGATAARAFAEARALYLRLVPLRARARPDDGLELTIRVEAAEASARAGRSVEAADGFLAASRLAGDREARMLRLRAAEGLLCAGHRERGEAVFDHELRVLGLSIGGTPAARIAGVVRDTIGVRVDRLRETRTSEARLAALWAAFRAAWMIDPVRSLAVGACLVREAARPGATAHARLAAQFVEAMSAVAPRGPVALTAALDRLGAARVEREDPVLEQLHALASGLVRLLGLDLRGAITALEDVARIAEVHGLGQSTEEASARAIAGSAAWILGDVPYLRGEVVPLAAELGERDHLIGWLLASMHGNWLTALEHGIEESERQLEEIGRRWTARGLELQAWWLDIGRLHFALVRGDGRTAWRLARPQARRYRERIFASLMHRLEAQVFLVRSVICLAGQGRATRGEVEEARAVIEDLASVPSPWARAHAWCLRAGLASVDGDRDGAVRALRAAAPVLDDVGFVLLRSLASDALGTLLGGEDGAARVRDARRDLARWRIDRERAIACTLPGAW